MLGYSLEELYTRPILDFIHPDDLEKNEEAEIQHQLGGGRVSLVRKSLSLQRRQLQDFVVEISARLARWMYAVARDITKQKIFEADLVGSSRRPRRSATLAKTVFLANMSHEIRTPLNGVVPE